MLTTDAILKSWREYLDRSPEWDRRFMLSWWRDNKPELWRMFVKDAGKHSELVREVDACLGEGRESGAGKPDGPRAGEDESRQETAPCPKRV